MTSKEKLIADLKIKIESNLIQMEDVVRRKQPVLEVLNHSGIMNTLQNDGGMELMMDEMRDIVNAIDTYLAFKRRIDERIRFLEIETAGFIFLSSDQEVSAQTVYVPDYVKKLNIEPKRDVFVDVVCKDSKRVYRFGYDEKEQVWGVWYEVNYDDFCIANEINPLNPGEAQK